MLYNCLGLRPYDCLTSVQQLINIPNIATESKVPCPVAATDPEIDKFMTVEMTQEVVEIIDASANSSEIGDKKKNQAMNVSFTNCKVQIINK